MAVSTEVLEERLKNAIITMENLHVQICKVTATIGADLKEIRYQTTTTNSRVTKLETKELTCPILITSKLQEEKIRVLEEDKIKKLEVETEWIRLISKLFIKYPKTVRIFLLIMTILIMLGGVETVYTGLVTLIK